MTRRQQEGPAQAQPSLESTAAAEILERALAQVESMPRDLADLKRSLSEVFRELQDALARLDRDARHLSDESARLAAVTNRLSERLDLLGSPLAPGPFAEEVRPHEPVAPLEPQFLPNGDAVRVVLAAVPGFQGLMESQRALDHLGRASVVAFKNGEAALEVTLREPVTAREIVDGLRTSTGHQLLIEEARPESLRLRLRFVE